MAAVEEAVLTADKPSQAKNCPPVPESSFDCWATSGTEAVWTLALFGLSTLFFQWRDRRQKKARVPKSKPPQRSSKREHAQPRRSSGEMSSSFSESSGTWKLPVAQKHAAESGPLIQAIRAGRTAELPVLLREACFQARVDCRRAGEPSAELCSKLAASTTRACVTRRYFQLGLTAFDAVESFVGSGSPELWSVLLYAATEAHRYDRGQIFFERLRRTGDLKTYDYVNMIRCLASANDTAGMTRMLQDIKHSAQTLDSVARNKALAACVSEGATDFLDLIIHSGICGEGLDIVAYNTMMKGYLKSNDTRRLFLLKRDMEARRTAPTATTHAILLEAAAKCQDVAEARRAAKNICATEGAFGAVNCTSALKWLTSMGLLEEARDMLRAMRAQGCEPSLVCYAIVLRSYANRGFTREAIGLLTAMASRSKGKPDEQCYHAVLEGCCQDVNCGAEVVDILGEIIKLGFKPNTVTLSITLKALCNARCFEKATHFLDYCLQHYPDMVKPRLFLQVGQACVRNGQQERAVQLYRRSFQLAVDVSDEDVDAWLPEQLIRTCLAHGAKQAANELRHMAEARGVPLHQWVGKSLSNP